MTAQEREFLKGQLVILENALADSANRIKDIQDKRKQYSERYEGIRDRLVKAEAEEVEDW